GAALAGGAGGRAAPVSLAGVAPAVAGTGAAAGAVGGAGGTAGAGGGVGGLAVVTGSTGRMIGSDGTGPANPPETGSAVRTGGGPVRVRRRRRRRSVGSGRPAALGSCGGGASGVL